MVDGAHLLALLEDGRGAEEDRHLRGAEGRGRPGHELGPQGRHRVRGLRQEAPQVCGAQGGPLQAA